MKRILYIYLFIQINILLFCNGKLFSQVKIGNNVTNVNPAAILELESTNKGLLLPRIADTSLIINPPDGLMVFSISPVNAQHLFIRNLGKWAEVPTTQTISSILSGMASGNINGIDSTVVVIGADSAVFRNVVLYVNKSKVVTDTTVSHVIVSTLVLDSLAQAVGKPPFTDSVIALINRQLVQHGHTISSTSQVFKIQASAGAVNSDVSISMDSLALAHVINTGPVKDTVNKMINGQLQNLALPMGSQHDSLVTIQGGQLRKLPIDSLLLTATGLSDPVAVYQAISPSTVFPASPVVYPGSGNLTFQNNEAVKLVFVLAGARVGDVAMATASPGFDEALLITKVIVTANDTVVVTVVNGVDAILKPPDLKLSLSLIRANK